MDEDEKYFKEHGEPLFSSHMVDLSEEEVAYNIEVRSSCQPSWTCADSQQTTAKYLKRG